MSSIYTESVVSSSSLVSSGSGVISAASSGSLMSGAAKSDIINLKMKKELEGASWARRNLYPIINHTIFSSTILFIIIVNTMILALQTLQYVNQNYVFCPPEGWYLAVVDNVFLGIYLMETILKIYVFRKLYFQSGWNLFDLFIVLTSLVNFLLPLLFVFAVSFNTNVIRLLRLFRTFRAIRSLRVLRTITFLKSLQIIVQTLLQSIPAMSSIVALAALVLYIFAVIGRTLYGSVDPARFGSLGKTFFRLFSLMTLDEWTSIWHDNKAKAPEIFVFLMVFIILETFVFLNLFIAVIVSNLEQSRSRLEAQNKRKKKIMKSPELPDDLDNVRPSFHDLKTLQDVEMKNLFEEELGIDNYYSQNLPKRQKQLMSKYFMLLASLEHNYGFYQKQQKVLDDLGRVFPALLIAV
ncbi:Ion transport protein-domain-containing protein [Paraphysoderma sedebokerense]|nr:Ion transport protein-domain-containing protein [Paraphysoderma sedebokerense]